jgi:hypothetical protein
VRIVETPVFTADGELIATSGSYPGSGIYYAPVPGLVVPAVPLVPSQDEIARAREFILEIVCDFPFVSEAERANAFAVLFEQPARDLIAAPFVRLSSYELVRWFTVWPIPRSITETSPSLAGFRAWQIHFVVCNVCGGSVGESSVHGSAQRVGGVRWLSGEREQRNGERAIALVLPG